MSTEAQHRKTAIHSKLQMLLVFVFQVVGQGTV